MNIAKEEVLQRASKSAFYKEHWKGVQGECFEDYPFTTKEDLRRAGPWGMVAVPMESIVRIHMSTGTTGLPTVSAYTEQDLEFWRGKMEDSLRIAGVKSAMKALITFPYGLSSGGLGAHYGMERLGMAIPASGETPEKLQALWEMLTPEVLMATPSFAAQLAEECSETPFKIGIFGGEPWSESMRSRLEQSLGIIAVDIYGLSEVMGPGVAVEVPGDQQLVLWREFYAEIVDPDTGALLLEGEEGELVLTTLARWGSPLVRYRTGDITRLLGGLGLARIRGRSSDRLSLQGKVVYPRDIEDLILSDERVGTMYKIQMEGGSMIVHCEGPSELENPLRNLIGDSLGVSVTMKMWASGILPRGGHKAERVMRG